MAGHANLRQTVNPGETVKPWLRLGPVYQDVSSQAVGRTYLERPESDVGRRLVEQVAAQLGPLQESAAAEGDSGAICGEETRWQLVRRPEPYLVWGRYFTQNHLVAAVLAAHVTAAESGDHPLQLLLRTPCCVRVTLDGQVLFASDGQVTEQRERGDEVARFTARLSGEQQLLSIALLRVGRGCRVGFRLVCPGGTLHVAVPAHGQLSAAARVGVEREWQAARLTQDLLHPADAVAVHVQRFATGPAALRVELRDGGGRLEAREAAPKAEEIHLLDAGSLDDGDYSIACRWTLPDGTVVAEKPFAIHKLTPTEPAPGQQRLAERSQRVLEHMAAQAHHPRTIANIWPQVARYALDRAAQVDPDALHEVCAYLDARHDCSDFAIHGLLRLLYWERQAPRLSADLRTKLKETVLNFKYWADEPVDTVMWMDSENHRFLFHSAEWLAGQLYPNEEFTNSRQRGLFHATRGRMYSMEWLRQRGRFGFDEWYSNVYYPVNMPGLINLYDFIVYEDFSLRKLASAVLDYLIYQLAAHSFQGVLGTSHGRSYTRHLVHPEREGTAAMSWLLFGRGTVPARLHGLGVVPLATSDYQVPEVLDRIAADSETIIDARMRQGVHRHHRTPADLRLYRTPDYMLASLQDHRKGERGAQVHVGQVTLPGKVAVFWSCPETSGEGGGLRPDYWSGNAVLPRCIQHENVMALHWRLRDQTWLTHCFFEPARFDEVSFHDSWVFARRGRAYLAIYSHHGMELGGHGQYQGRELVCHAPANTWLVECGRQADWDSFDAFQAAVAAARVEETAQGISYASPSVGLFVSGWEGTPTLDGEPLDIHGYPLVADPWAYARFGAGELTIDDGTERLELWFNQ